jgi:hypothetical protein
MGTRLGSLTKVPNKCKKFNENEYYYSAWIKVNGKTVPVMFTQDQIDSATSRANRNPEDVVGRSLSSLILD